MNNEKISTSLLLYFSTSLLLYFSTSLLLFSLLSSLLNCASGGSNYKYSSQLSNIANPNETQFGIKPGNPLYPSKDMTLLAFDHYLTLIALDDETSFPNGFIFIVLKPGEHTVKVNLSSPNFRSKTSMTVKFTAKANQTVFICREQTRTSWNPQAKSLDGFLPETNFASPCNNEF